MSPYRHSPSSCLCPLCSYLLKLHPSTAPCRSAWLRMDSWQEWEGDLFHCFFQQIRPCPAFLEPKCLILSWLVVPDEKGVAFYCSIQKSSLLLGSGMKMVQMRCSDVPRPATHCMFSCFQMKIRGWRHGLQLKSACNYQRIGVWFPARTSWLRTTCTSD